MVKCLSTMQETWVQSLGRVQSPEEGNEEGKNTTPVFLPGESHGQRSLVGYSPWGRKDYKHIALKNEDLKVILIKNINDDILP